MNFFMRPLLFFPLAIIAAGLIVVIGLEPQRWARAAHAVDGAMEGQTLILTGEAFDAPSPSPEQHVKVHRSFWGVPKSFSIAVLPNQPEPTPAERGVRLLLSPEAAAALQDRPVIVEVDYNPLNMNTASGLAVSLQGIAPADWVIQEISAQTGSVRFELPAQFAVDAIGLRAMSHNDDQAYGLEITSIRITPSGA
ncbi:MAG TPA: hypothetical protein PKY87_03915 [Terricaulis sp.]|nr:hypothetical protein [Terricaulis sp.]